MIFFIIYLIYLIYLGILFIKYLIIIIIKGKQYNNKPKFFFNDIRLPVIHGPVPLPPPVILYPPPPPQFFYTPQKIDIVDLLFECFIELILNAVFVCALVGYVKDSDTTSFVFQFNFYETIQKDPGIFIKALEDEIKFRNAFRDKINFIKCYQIIDCNLLADNSLADYSSYFKKYHDLFLEELHKIQQQRHKNLFLEELHKIKQEHPKIEQARILRLWSSVINRS